MSAAAPRPSGLEAASRRTTPRSATSTCGTLFAADPERASALVAEGAGLYLDYSKNRITDETLTLLGELGRRARASAERRDAMFRGEHINVSEDRAGPPRRPADADATAR